MKPIVISSRSKTVNELLKKARRGTVILESSDGQRFALSAVDKWQGFDVGESQDFATEVERTSRNKPLIKFLASRRKRENGSGIPLSEVKKRLGIR